MPQVRYVFGDLRTGLVLNEIALQGVTMTKKLNDWGSFNGTFTLDQSGQTNTELEAATVPGRCFVVCERDGVPIWDGIIWARTYQSQAKTLQIAARSIEAYLEKSLVRVTKIYTLVEQRNILIDLLETLQNSSDQNLRIAVPADYPTVVPRTLTVLASEFKNYLQVISAFADSDDGFDWTIFTGKSSTGSYERSLRIGYPTLGASTTGLSFDYPGGAIINYYKTESMTNGGTHMFVLGAGEGSEMIVGTSSHDDMTSGQWMRFDNVLSRKDIDQQDLADSYAARQNTFRRAPFTTIKVFVKEDVEPVFGSYQLGDLAAVSFNDPRHSEGITSLARMVAFAYRPPSSDGTGEAELIFEGDELNDG